MLAPSAAEMQLSGLRESPAPPNPSKRRASTAPPTAAELRASGHVTVSHSLRGKLVLPCADVATVGQLKAQVADRLGLDLDNLALFHRSKALRDDDDAVDAGMRFYAAYCSPASRGRGGRYYAYCAWCPGWTVRNPARLALISLIAAAVLSTLHKFTTCSENSACCRLQRSLCPPGRPRSRPLLGFERC